MRYMLDTNLCIYLMKAHPPEVMARLLQLDHGDVVMSIITYAELRVGLEGLGSSRAQNERALHLLTTDIPVLPFGEAAAERYGVQRAVVRDRRRDAFDRLIAAHAASLGLTLVTHNETDFRDYPGLIVENWV